MRSGRASRTAEHNALFRALETACPADQRLFADPLARRFLSWRLAPVAALAMVPGGQSRACRFIDERWPGVRTSVVARTRLIDDAISDAAPGRAQLVVLGAGFDARPYRLVALRDLDVFEVDHPDTQRAKQRVLRRTLRTMPERVQFVASDFNERHLDSAMLAAGYRGTEPTIFVWEGVTNYLTEAAVDATMRWCSRAAAGSLLIFTYVNIDVLTDPARYVGAERLFSTLDHVDEQLTFGIDPAETAAFVAARGLTLDWDVGAAEYRAQMFGDDARTMHGHEFYRVAAARVG